MRRIILDLLRHGQALGDDCYRGRTDFALTALGRRQMLAWQGAEPGWQAVLSSPLQRCADIAQLLAGDSGLICQTDAGLLEYDFGDWDGRPYADVWQSARLEVEAFWNNPGQAAPPNGETLAQLAQRVARLQARLIDQPHDHWLLVTHGGVIRAWLAQVLGVPPERWSLWQLAPASRSRIQLDIDTRSGQLWASVAFVNQAPPRCDDE